VHPQLLWERRRRAAGQMGKIKNLEEKKKAARVFSSGSGGGTKGPAVVDKRNQELACPHCPRVFKQVGLRGFQGFAIRNWLASTARASSSR
jgi:hypothetical protein